jgi:hypothetical protein
MEEVMTVAADIGITLATQLKGSADLEVVTSVITEAYKVALTDGTGAKQADKIWADRRTLADGANESIDLSGALLDALGNSVAFTKLKAVIIVSNAANTTALTLGNVANGIVGFFGAATHSITVGPGGMFLIASPDATAYAVVAGTADLLKIANAAGAAATYDIFVIGV